MFKDWKPQEIIAYIFQSTEQGKNEVLRLVKNRLEESLKNFSNITEHNLWSKEDKEYKEEFYDIKKKLEKVENNFTIYTAYQKVLDH